MFKKLLISYLITTVVLTVLISSLSLYVYSRKVKEDLAAGSRTDLTDVSNHVATIEDEIDQLSLQFSLMPELNNVLRDPFDTTILQYGDLKETLKNQTTVDSLFYSIYVYFRLNDKVLTTGEGLFDLRDFPDAAIVREALQTQDNYKWQRMRTLTDPVDGQKTDLITFDRPVPISNKLPLGNLLLNIRKSVFFDDLYKMSGLPVTGSDVYVLDRSRFQVLSNNGLSGLSEAMKRLSDTDAMGNSGIAPVEIDHRRVLASFLSPRDSDWIYVKLIPYGSYSGQILMKFKEIVGIAIVMLAIGALLSYLFALRMARPWKRIVNSYFDSGESAGVRDESKLVSEAIGRLVTENRTFKSTLQQNEPIIRFRLIYEMLTDSLVESDLIEERLSQVGVGFPHADYLAMVVAADLSEFERQKDYNQIKLMLFSIIENAMKQHVFTIGTIMDSNQFGFILNLQETAMDDGLKWKLRTFCQDIARAVANQFNISTQFAFGSVQPVLDTLHHSYLEARQAMNAKALIKEADIVFFEDMRNEDRPDYPLTLQKQLIGHVKTGNLAKANGTLERLFEKYVYDMAYSREQVQEMLIMFMSAVLQSLYEDGYAIQDTEYSSARIAACRDNTELEELLYKTVGELIGQQAQLQDRMSNNLYIAKAIQYIENHYRDIASVSDIAAHVGLSSSYLSRIFRAELGKPPLDYLTKLRIEKSKSLLEEGEYKYSLQEICASIGYNDVQSFIRFFKKYENRTPGEYRKLLLQQK